MIARLFTRGHAIVVLEPYRHKLEDARVRSPLRFRASPRFWAVGGSVARWPLMSASFGMRKGAPVLKAR